MPLSLKHNNKYIVLSELYPVYNIPFSLIYDLCSDSYICEVSIPAFKKNSYVYAILYNINILTVHIINIIHIMLYVLYINIDFSKGCEQMCQISF